MSRTALLLTLLTGVNLLNYLDRYILAALAPAIQKDLQLSDLSLGLLGTAFMLTYFAISPLFGWLGDRGHRLRWMGAGVALWSLATAASGLAKSFAGMLAARLGVGVGEASYATISPAVISDLYPVERRGKAFAIFFMAVPVGSALGFLLGGLLEHWLGWRQAFLVAGIPGLALAIWVFFVKDPERGRFDKHEAQRELPLAQVYALLARNHSYVLTVLGYAAYTFVVGGVAFWMPAFLLREHGLELARANIIFGGITVVAGFLGTIVGGFWADRWASVSGDAYMKLSALSALLAAIPLVLCLLVHTLPAFLALLFVLEFLLFLSTSPINAQVVQCVPVRFRATANALCIFVIHILGDAISPSLIGAISDVFNLRIALFLAPVGIFLAGLIWAAKVIFYWETLPWPAAWSLPKSQCHRGYHFEGIQENTLQAFRAAKKHGATMVELDVRLSADGVVVVVHDEDIVRISGQAGRVTELTAKELLARAQAPSLEDVLSDAEVTAYVNIELKSDSAGDKGLESAVAATVKRAGAEGRVLFSSFNPLALRRISRHLPRAPRALLVTDEDDPKNKIYLRKMWLAALARPHLLHMDQHMYTAAMAAALARRGIKVAVWTIETALEAKNCLARGAESIISPVPAIAD